MQNRQTSKAKKRKKKSGSWSVSANSKFHIPKCPQGFVVSRMATRLVQTESKMEKSDIASKKKPFDKY